MEALLKSGNWKSRPSHWVGPRRRVPRQDGAARGNCRNGFCYRRLGSLVNETCTKNQKMYTLFGLVPPPPPPFIPRSRKCFSTTRAIFSVSAGQPLQCSTFLVLACSPFRLSKSLVMPMVQYPYFSDSCRFGLSLMPMCFTFLFISSAIYWAFMPYCPIVYIKCVCLMGVWCILVTCRVVG